MPDSAVTISTGSSPALSSFGSTLAQSPPPSSTASTVRGYHETPLTKCPDGDLSLQFSGLHVKLWIQAYKEHPGPPSQDTRRSSISSHSTLTSSQADRSVTGWSPLSMSPSSGWSSDAMAHGNYYQQWWLPHTMNCPQIPPKAPRIRPNQHHLDNEIRICYLDARVTVKQLRWHLYEGFNIHARSVAFCKPRGSVRQVFMTFDHTEQAMRAQQLLNQRPLLGNKVSVSLSSGVVLPPSRPYRTRAPPPSVATTETSTSTRNSSPRIWPVIVDGDQD